MYVRTEVVVARPEVTRLRFEDFYAAEFDRVFRSAYALSRDPHTASEATQEAFSRAFARWTRLRRKDWAGAWVTTTALNLVRRHIRDASRTPPQVSPDTSESETVASVDLLRALSTLPWRQRQAATLFYVADLPVVAVAEAMGLSQGAVKSHLSRARQQLRSALGEQDDG